MQNQVNENAVSIPKTDEELQAWWDGMNREQRLIAYEHGHVASGDLLSLAPGAPGSNDVANL